MLSIAEFANRAGVSRQAVYGAIKRGKLPPAISGKIDEADPLAAEYLSGQNPSVPRQVSQSVSSTNSHAQQSGGISRAAIDAEKAKQQAIHWQLRNQEKRGSLIDRELVMKSVEITDEEHHRLLADGAKTITKTIYDLAKSGATLEECIDAFRREASLFLRSWKEKLSRALKFFYNEQTTGE